jgi:hypothetical protein
MELQMTAQRWAADEATGLQSPIVMGDGNRMRAFGNERRADRAVV